MRSEIVSNPFLFFIHPLIILFCMCVHVGVGVGVCVHQSQTTACICKKVNYATCLSKYVCFYKYEYLESTKMTLNSSDGLKTKSEISNLLGVLFTEKVNVHLYIKAGQKG